MRKPGMSGIERLQEKVARLEAENAALKARAERAEKVVEAVRELKREYGNPVPDLMLRHTLRELVFSALDAYEKWETK